MRERTPGQEPHPDGEEREYESYPSPEASLAAARAGAIAPAAVELVPTPGGGVVVITLASDELPAAMVGVMTQTPPPGGYDTTARWMVAQVAPGSGYSPTARYQLWFDDGDVRRAELALAIDLCEYAEALDAAVRGAPIGLVLLEHPDETLFVPSVDMAPVAIALRALASHRLQRPAWRLQPDALPGAGRERAQHRWTKTHSLAAAERETRALTDRQGVGTVGDALFDEAAITAARAAAPRFADAHPLVVAGDLLNGLPDWEQDRHAYQYGLRARLPLPVLYIDLSSKHGDPVRLGEAERWASTHVGPPPLPLHGALCWEDDEHGLAIVPFGVDRRGGPVPEPRLLFQFTRSQSAEIEPEDRRLWFTADEKYLANVHSGLAADMTDLAAGHLWRLSAPLVTTILSLLYLLESANVELRPAVVYGKAARRAAAAGQTPASVIHIHSPAARSTGDAPQPAGKLTERHWRRGSYAHYSADTRIGAAKPEKLAWVPERAGYYRKIWRRPTIVGPADAPVRLKTRKWTLGPDPRLPAP